MSDLYNIALKWEKISADERLRLRAVVEAIVGYPCKMACEADNGWGSVDLFVLSVKKNEITDWLEIQETGAIGVVDESYPHDVKDRYLDKLQDKCDKYNSSIGVEFVSEGEGESGGEAEDEVEAEDEAEVEEGGELEELDADYDSS